MRLVNEHQVFSQRGNSFLTIPELLAEVLSDLAVLLLKAVLLALDPLNLLAFAEPMLL